MNATVTAQLKHTAQRVLPRPFVFHLRQLGAKVALARSGAGRAFAQAPSEPTWLPAEALAVLHREMPPLGGTAAHALQRLHAHYTRAALDERAEARVRQLRRAIGSEAREVRRSLELGCGEGVVSHVLWKEGVRAAGIDVRGEVFDSRALAAGVDLREMDAASLAFRDGAFDLVYSFDAFEHFPHPERVLAEALRVTRPGGLIYLDFGPLYDSPWGLHADAVLGIPYVQHLFPRSVTEHFCREEGLPPIHFEQCNGWSLGQYRRLFEAHAGELDTLCWFEKLDVSGLGLIERHPSCFRGKAAALEDLLVGYVEVLVRKRG
jgi:SAM-dependent methyltransferase